MPRKNPIPPTEAAIGGRVRIVRERRGLSRVAFAQGIQCDSTVLTNIEHGRSPLRYALGNRIGERFNISQRWLATGALPSNVFFPVGRDIAGAVSPRDLFSAVYATHLAARIETELAKAAESIGCKVEDLEDAPGDSGSDEPAVLGKWIAWRAKILPAKLRAEFLNVVMSSAEVFLSLHDAESRRLQRLPRESGEMMVGPCVPFPAQSKIQTSSPAKADKHKAPRARKK